MKPKTDSPDRDRLLRIALDLERKVALDREAADFFSVEPSDRKERRALEKVTLTSIARK
jgi:hypothetical protein